MVGVTVLVRTTCAMFLRGLFVSRLVGRAEAVGGVWGGVTQLCGGMVWSEAAAEPGGVARAGGVAFSGGVAWHRRRGPTAIRLGGGVWRGCAY